ncbi:MAG: Wzz/FepE/Etk N-terminal domain-containing protein [Polyangiaceae bacterium]
MSFAPDPEQPEENDGSVGISPQEWIKFVLSAARRHKLLGIASLVVVASLGIAISIAIPPIYEANAKILVSQSALATAVLSNPNRQLPNVDPMRGVSDITMTRDNMEAIIRETGLIDHWFATRSPLLKAKDWLWSMVVGPIPEADKMRALIGVLETRLSVKAEDATTIKIEVFWGDKEMVVRLAKATRDKFLQARVGEETAVISAAIGVIEDELKRASEAIEPALGSVVRAREKAKDARAGVPSTSADAGAPQAGETAAPAPSTFVRAAPAKPAGPDPAVSAKLAEIRQAQRNVQEPWQRRLTELRVQLADLRSQYGTAHPLVVQQEAKIKDGMIEPAELVALRQEERDLISRIESGQVSPADAAAGRWVPTARAGAATPSAPVLLEEDPEVSAARQKLMSAVSKYDELKNRLDAARIELTTTEIAFKYRYVVVAEPELPRKPIKPNRPMLILASLAGGILAGLLAGAIRELTSGRIVESWQVKQIGLPLLADVHLSDRPDR